MRLEVLTIPNTGDTVILMPGECRDPNVTAEICQVLKLKRRVRN